MIRVLDSAGSTLVEWGRQQQQQHDDNICGNIDKSNIYININDIVDDNKGNNIELQKRIIITIMQLIGQTFRFKFSKFNCIVTVNN